VKEHIGLVVLEHLRNQLYVHVLDVDVLPVGIVNDYTRKHTLVRF
jgi:hypothetical protein